MTRRLLKSSGLLLLYIWGAASLIFLLARSIPGDPLLEILGPNPDRQDVARLRHSLRLDRPLAEQYARFLLRLAVLDLGESLVDRRPVMATLRRYLPNTALLALAAMALTLPLSLLLGFLSLYRGNRPWEALVMAFSTIGLAVPVFLIGLFLILVFALGLGIFPVSGSGSGEFLVLPALTLAIPLSAFLTRMVRTALQKESQRPYVLLAMAKGLSQAQVYRRHILKNALLPIVTLAGMQAGALLSGAIVVESVFSWPGIGTLLVRAVRQRDFPVIQGTVLLMAALYLLLNLLVDLSYPLLDPRIGHDRTG
ncbi:MAG: ABC transporter permease [Acidobacteria bacterium]|jgi:ABC-type dipeptide/oligopeptide/nickel transport system permease component|nr:ABC transporter permease [Acidobacteriota bacterium]